MGGGTTVKQISKCAIIFKEKSLWHYQSVQKSSVHPEFKPVADTPSREGGGGFYQFSGTMTFFGGIAATSSPSNFVPGSHGLLSPRIPCSTFPSPNQQLTAHHCFNIFGEYTSKYEIHTI